MQLAMNQLLSILVRNNSTFVCIIKTTIQTGLYIKQLYIKPISLLLRFWSTASLSILVLYIEVCAVSLLYYVYRRASFIPTQQIS